MSLITDKDVATIIELSRLITDLNNARIRKDNLSERTLDTLLRQSLAKDDLVRRSIRANRSLLNPVLDLIRAQDAVVSINKDNTDALTTRVHQLEDQVLEFATKIEMRPMTTASEDPNWQKVFLTKIVGPEDVPDIEVITFQSPPQSNLTIDLEALRRLICTPAPDETAGFRCLGASPVAQGSKEISRAIISALSDAALREKMPLDPERWEKYAGDLMNHCELPIQRSPISGDTIIRLLGSGGPAAVFMANFDMNIGNIVLYFLLIGGTPLVIGAGTVGSDVLEKLKGHLLQWLGTPLSTANPLKRKVRG